MKQLIVNTEHPNGVVQDISRTTMGDELHDALPTEDERIAALEAAMLSLVLGGGENG